MHRITPPKSCRFCNDLHPTVRFRADPYMLELHGDYTKYWICNQCAHDRYMET